MLSEEVWECVDDERRRLVRRGSLEDMAGRDIHVCAADSLVWYLSVARYCCSVCAGAVCVVRLGSSFNGSAGL